MRKLVIFPVDLLLTPDRRHYDQGFIQHVAMMSDSHWFVAVSNRSEPEWFKKTGVKAGFCHAPSLGGGSRQKGKFVSELLKLNQVKLNLQKSQVVVLGYGELDVPMYANSQCVLIRCDWRPDVHPKILRYGIPCPDPQFLPHILKLLNEEHPWYFRCPDPCYDTYCLTNAATRVGSDEELKQLAAQLQACLKSGDDKRRWDFMVHLLSSFYATDVFRTVDIWSYFPSSRSTNTGQEVIANFADIARTTFKRRKKDNPLIVRHTPTIARHAAPQASREDPSTQIRTIHLHPDYRGAVSGKTVVVLDDYMTYGVSFSVAAAFLRRAGAAKVLAVAIGKFPRTSYLKEIELDGDPFAPVKTFKTLRTSVQLGQTAPAASEVFKSKFQ